MATSSLIGCLSVGRPFPTDRVAQIRIGQTTQAQIEDVFGLPWRRGLEDGQPTWTYAQYRYSLFSDAQTRDLVVRFDDSGIVDSYTFNSTYRDELEP